MKKRAIFLLIRTEQGIPGRRSIIGKHHGTMNSVQLEIQLIAAVVAVACALPGVFLVLRRMALISDAISHSILLGIVLGFFVTQTLNSPVLILLAALTGILTVVDRKSVVKGTGGE